ncbi:Hypothetical predicted protein [Podarcis lilfordi]|uniref:Uncharacterized protein n=1 Tax=Podarcis lilfordi TaxID=74358 RepID=A0AA35KH91_9SAUR|nr:Hypothetical predicted protein [Podarcis lilfordi]
MRTTLSYLLGALGPQQQLPAAYWILLESKGFFTGHEEDTDFNGSGIVCEEGYRVKNEESTASGKQQKMEEP